MDTQQGTRDRLRAWIAEQGGMGAAAKRIGCHRTYLVHLLGNPDRRPGLDIAFEIERATDGAIPAADWTRLRELPGDGDEANVDREAGAETDRLCSTAQDEAGVQ